MSLLRLRLDAMRQEYDGRRSAHIARLGQAQAHQTQLAEAVAQHAAAAELSVTAAEVALLLQSYSEAEHDQLRSRVEALVTMGLQAVFDATLSFRCAPDVSRGQAVINFTVVSTDPATGAETESSVLEARGGGLAAIIGLLLRVVVIALHPERRRKLLVLDETLGMVSADHHEHLAVFLRRLVDDLGMQILLVTHAPGQAAHADCIYRIGHDGSKSLVTAIGAEDL